jgi:hypothetical protein
MAVITFPDPTPANPNGILSGAKVITPSDTDTFERGVFVRCGGAGNLVCSPENGQADVTLAVVAGYQTTFRVKAVKSTSTTATLIHAIY